MAETAADSPVTWLTKPDDSPNIVASKHSGFSGLPTELLENIVRWSRSPRSHWRHTFSGELDQARARVEALELAVLMLYSSEIGGDRFFYAQDEQGLPEHRVETRIANTEFYCKLLGCNHFDPHGAPPPNAL